MKEKSSIISRVRAVKEGVRIELLYSDDVMRRSMDKLFIDIVEEFNKKKGR